MEKRAIEQPREGEKPSAHGDTTLANLVETLAHDLPELASLSEGQLEALAKAVAFDELKTKFQEAVFLERIPYEALKGEFLASLASAHTKAAYMKGIAEFEAYALRLGKSPIAITPREADSFIRSLAASLSPSTVRLRIASISAFFTFLERATENRVANPIRGTKARPKKASKVPIVPKREEVEALLPRLNPVYRAAIVLMLEHGFRVGAIPTLRLWGERYTGSSKGKQIQGVLSPIAMKAIETLEERKEPFKGLTADTIRDAFRYATKKGKEAGTLQDCYSVHDLRHLFAITEYRKDKDIYRLKGLLGHESIAITETYLQGLKGYL